MLFIYNQAIGEVSCRIEEMDKIDFKISAGINDPILMVEIDLNDRAGKVSSAM